MSAVSALLYDFELHRPNPNLAAEIYDHYWLHGQSASITTDAAYDALCKRLYEIEALAPELTPRPFLIIRQSVDPAERQKS